MNDDELTALTTKLHELCEEFDEATARAAFEKKAVGLSPDQRTRIEALVFFGEGTQIGTLSIDAVVGGDQQQGAVNIAGQARIYGPTVGINLGTVIYGHAPQEDARRRLVWYLHALAGDLRCLPLRGLDAPLAEGRGVNLAQVYVMLATERTVVVATGTAAVVGHYFQDADPQQALLPAYDPDQVLPDVALICQGDAGHGGTDAVYQLARQRLGSEAARAGSFVLLGDPGGGKSTFLRHLAWVLARRGLDQLGPATQLVGWDDERRLMPVLLPLRRLSSTLAGTDSGASGVYAALRAMVAAQGIDQPDDLLTDALVRGAAIILLDGLDEVPVAATATSADRLTTLRAVRAFAERYHQTSLILTCRTRAFDDTLRAALGWPVETLAPFTLGQIRHFVPAWYHELVDAGQLTPDQAARLSAELVATIAGRARLRAMAATPLLLTLMALLLFRRGTLPRDRPRLYEDILELLLGQWDKVRDGQSLAEVIGRPDWTSERLRPLLDRLSYDAHLAGSSHDGRGRLGREAVRAALISFFEQQTPSLDWGAAQRCLTYFEQRSGLLAPDGPDSYVFAHLTLQEHCAGRHMLLSREAVGHVLARRSDDRWREPIFLGLGVVQANNPYLVEKVLRTLLEQREGGAAKPVARWYRDCILVAEIGQDRDWAYLRDQGVDVDSLHEGVRAGLVALLADRTQPLPVAERVRAGFLLGDLGDPRFPVMVEEWRAELARAGQPGSYFCRIEAGTYRIGSTDDDPDADDNEKPQHTVTFDTPFYIARYPLTNAQWQAWVAQGGEASHFADDGDLNHPNQPVVAITWQMSNDFCAWVSKESGTTVHVPTEQEWEAAARGSTALRYPWGNDWRDDHAATEEDRATRGGRWSVPVSCYPAGAAPCGALDMAGNVWEWTASVWQSYPGAEKAFTEDNRRVLRGGGYGNNKTNVRCGARVRGRPDYGLYLYGVRVCLAPRSR
jgi:formylglycine-generating enzyme required for sulfatase activity